MSHAELISYAESIGMTSEELSSYSGEDDDSDLITAILAKQSE